MKQNNPSDLSELTSKQVYFFDLDGTLYLGNRLFDGVNDLINLLKSKNINFFFLSNNSSKSTKDYLKRLNSFNLTVNLENIILSQHPTIDFLKSNGYKKVFLLGTQSLKDEFIQEGLIITEDDPEILVLAFDQELTYKRLEKASYFLQNSDIPYIATHLDDRCPTESGYIPDAGGIAALLYKTTGKYPNVFGKPNKQMLLFKISQLEILPEKAIIFGDRLYTDIRMGNEAGVTTCCVLSGESTRDDIKNSDYKPDFILNGIWELLDEFLKL